VTIPPNTSAIVCVPADSAEDVTESGTPVTQTPGVRLLGQDRTKLRFLVDAGTYEFATRL